QRIGLIEPQGFEPGTACQAEEGPPVCGRIEHRGLARDLDGVDGERVEAGGSDPDLLRRAGDLEQCGQRGLEPQVVERRDNCESGILRSASEWAVLTQGFVRLQTQPELTRGVGHVNSSVWSVRSPMRSILITTRSSGSGQQTSESCSSQSDSGS